MLRQRISDYRFVTGARSYFLLLTPRFPILFKVVFSPWHDQYRRLQQTFALNRDAALEACSWGGFQIIGKNHAAARYGTMTEFVQAMFRSTDQQCDAFVSLVKSDHALWQALR